LCPFLFPLLGRREERGKRERGGEGEKKKKIFQDPRLTSSLSEPGKRNLKIVVEEVKKSQDLRNLRRIEAIKVDAEIIPNLR
jgi:hypothetical protein